MISTTQLMTWELTSSMMTQEKCGGLDFATSMSGGRAQELRVETTTFAFRTTLRRIVSSSAREVVATFCKKNTPFLGSCLHQACRWLLT